MAVKLICFGVRPVEVNYFEELNKNFNYELTLVSELLSPKNTSLAQKHDAVLLRANCFADETILNKFASYNIKYLLTRTVGYNHIDIEYARNLGIKMAYVPYYSPNAIAELVISMSMNFLRHLSYTTHRTQAGNFTIDEIMFSKEIRSCTVGIIGMGKIGLTVARLFQSLGASVIGHDPSPSIEAQQYSLLPLDDILLQSDIITLHCPYIPDKNYHFINEDFLKKMKKGSILINTARGELQDINAIIKSLKSNHLGYFGTDTIEDESQIFFQNWKDQIIPNKDISILMDLYPQVLITPHIGSYTQEALTNMIQISYQNLQELLNNSPCSNEL
ncbi:D-lactate dehydrogenase [Brevinema andersonii]|uniref:D-lactate dehydrogenase n=1 Tax=Brevinema andersonii TaxID=34097 RepID=A0A1I1DIQ3_BREAD|nr:NAD(P)-dependent oxidoreductase [Brevinema andersonii]SFB74859.1 D-lactate dehydrogenase [Brevinema andersonii]